MSREATPEKRKRSRSMPSMLSRISDVMSSKSRANLDKAIEIFRRNKDQLDSEQRAQQSKLRWHDWMLAFAELCMSFSWGTFMARAQSERTLKMRNMTPREEKMERLICNGFAAIGNLLMGYLADSHIRSYGIVISNVTGHFILAGLFFMSEVIRLYSSEDQYGLVLSQIFLWMYIPTRATDFARIVYGMEQLSGSNSALVLYFAFIFQLASVSGSSLFYAIEDYGISFHIVTFLAFLANAIVLFLYYYVLVPQKVVGATFTRGIGEKIWGSIITALINRKHFDQQIKKESWLDYAENRYDKHHIQTTKKLVKMFLMILPTIGFLQFVSSTDDFLDSFKAILESGTDNYYKAWIVNAAGIFSMLAFEFVVVPWFNYRYNHQLSFHERFLIGYAALIFALFFSAMTTKVSERIAIGQDKAILRLINARTETVLINSYDSAFSKLNYSVEPRASKMVTYKTRIPRTLKLSVSTQKNQVKNNILHFYLKPYSLVGYLFLDPDIVYRLKGTIPIIEAPPGNNSRKMPRCIVANFIPLTDVVMDIENLVTGEKLFYSIASGERLVFQVEKGIYAFSLRDTLARVIYQVLIGGVYGIYVYLGIEDYKIQLDRIVEENTTPTLVGLGVTIPVGIAKGVGMVALVAFVFTNTPDGLKGISLGYLFFLGHISSWGLFIGFHTWHYYINSAALMTYSIIAVCLFFASFVLIVKYKKLYK